MSQRIDQIEKSAEYFIGKYKPYMHALENYSPLKRSRTLTAFD